MKMDVINRADGLLQFKVDRSEFKKYHHRRALLFFFFNQAHNISVCFFDFNLDKDLLMVVRYELKLELPGSRSYINLLISRVVKEFYGSRRVNNQCVWCAH